MSSYTNSQQDDGLKEVLSPNWVITLYIFHNWASSLCFKRNKNYGIILFCNVGVMLCATHRAPLKFSVLCLQPMASYIQVTMLYTWIHVFILWCPMSLHKVHNALYEAHGSSLPLTVHLQRACVILFIRFIVSCIQVRMYLHRESSSPTHSLSWSQWSSYWPM